MAMHGRGQASFIRLPAFAAKLYGRLTRSRAIDLQTREIAALLAPIIKQGKLLDVGMGPGWMLAHLHQLNPQLQLFGLDISAALLAQAKQNLAGIPVELLVGDIEQTNYHDEEFDLITCTGSFYLWDHPVTCLNEIHRILKPGACARLYETYADYDVKEMQQDLRRNLSQEDLLLRLISPILLKRQLKMTYQLVNFRTIIEDSRFKKHYQLVKRRLGGLPIWIEIQLYKQS